MYHLATRGWVCVAINYRLSPKATWPDHLLDCKRGARVGPRAHRGVRRRPRLRRRHGRLGRWAPHGADGPHAQRPAVPARVRVGRHARARDGAVLRRLRLDESLRSAREARRAAARARTLRREAPLRRRARGVRSGIADVARQRRRAAGTDRATAISTRSRRSPRRASSCRCCGRRAGRRSSTPSCAARTTRSTCSSRSARCRPSRPSTSSSHGCSPSTLPQRLPRSLRLRRRIGERCVSGGTTERSDVHGPSGAITRARERREALDEVHGVSRPIETGGRRLRFR